MVQNKTKTGRPLAFDRDGAMESAMNLFWDHGYLGVGLADLEARTGLNRSSLYNSFGSKEALFTLTLQRYTERLGTRMLSMLESGGGGLTDIEAFFKQLAAHLKAHAGRGCFMVNTMASSPGFVPNRSELVRRYINSFLKAVRAALGRAVLQGEIRAGTVNAGAEMVLGVVLAANLLARANQPHRHIESVLNSALLHLRWSSPAVVG